MAAADEDHGIVVRDRVEVAAVRKTMFPELRLVPVAVADNDVAGIALPDARRDRRENVSDRSGAGQIDAGAAAGVVQMIVGETGDRGLPFEVDSRRLRTREFPDVRVRADGREPAS